MISASSRARLLASGPLASQIITFPVSWIPSTLAALLTIISTVWPSFCLSLLSRLWGPGEEPVGMRSIPTGDFSVLTRENEKLSAWSAPRQTKAGALILLCCVCSEVQDPWPANEAVPQRKPAQKAALRQQQAHRERTPVHEGRVAGCTVSRSLAFLLYPVEENLGSVANVFLCVCISLKNDVNWQIQCRSSLASIFRS